MIPTRCFISRSVNIGDEKDKSEKTLNNLLEVSVNHNSRLQAIMGAQLMWMSSPTIFIDETPYKIKILELIPNKITLLQMYIKIFYKHDGRSWYEVINKRKVVIHFK